MDRSRDARSGSLLVSSHGLSRRRHRSGLRDPPDEDGPVELQESVRLRERGKKDRERERERPSTIRSSKRRRGENTIMIHGNNRGDDGGEDTSGSSVNYEEEDDNTHKRHHNSGDGMRLLAPNQNSLSNHYHHDNSNNNKFHNYNSNSNNNTNHQTRKSIPPSAGKVFRAPLVWKSEGMIGVSVPRKARSVSTKRSHDWISNNTIGGINVAGGEQINRQISNSPARPPSIDLRTAPLSPSYSNASAKKKIKQNGSKQPKPQKSSSKTSSLNPGELEIEIAEVLFGLKTQSPALKEIVTNDSVEINKSSSDAKSSVLSPVSNSPTAKIQSSPAVVPNFCSSGGCGSFTAVAPKRKKPRHVTENISGSFSVRSSPVSMKVETDQTPKILKKIDENGVCEAKSDELPAEQNLPELTRDDLESKPVGEELGESPDVVSKKELVNLLNKEIPLDATECIPEDVGVTVTVTALASMTIANSVAAVSQNEEKFQIDLEASPLRLRSSPESGEIHTTAVVAIEHKQIVSNVDESKLLEDEKPSKVGKSEVADANGEDLKLIVSVDGSEDMKKVKIKGRNGDVHLDLEKEEKDNVIINKLAQQSKKQPPQAEKSGQSNPLPMSIPSWPCGLPPMGYMAPIQGVVTMDGSTVSPVPVQAMVKQARPKRCATHCHIARNILYFQQFIKINPFWQSQGGSKPSNFSVVPPQTNVNGSISGGRVGSNVQDKAPVLVASQPSNVVDGSHRNQQILLQQSLSQVVPNNMLHGGPAFFFHLNQQAAMAVAGKQATTATSSTMASNNAANAAAAVSGGAATGFSFSYSNMGAANETKYVAIVPNNYPFPIPTAAAVTSPNYRGTHSQQLPMFNGSFYSSQIIHPSQQQPISQFSHQMQQNLQNSNLPNGSASSPSQKHQRPSGPAIASGNGGGGNRQLRQSNQHISSTGEGRGNREGVVPEGSLSTGDSRGGNRAAPVNIYGPHMHSQNYAIMASSTPATLPNGVSTNSTGSNNNQNEKELPQQQSVKTATESLSQFNYINGANLAPGFDLSAMTHNPAFLQGLCESTTHNIQTMTAQAQQQRKNVRNSEDSSAAMAAQTSMSNTTGPVSISNAQLQQNTQQMIQQQLASVRAKYNSTINVNGGYPSAEQLSSSMASPPQWKNTIRNSTSQSPSSALKNHPQQHNKGGHQNHTQFSIGSTQKSTSGSLQGGQPPPLSSSNQSPSSPTASSMTKGSPRTASVPAHNIISSAQVSSFSPHVKNSSIQTQNSSPVGIRNPNVSSTSSNDGGAKLQLQQQQIQQQMQQLHKDLQHTQIYFSNHQLQLQSPHPSAGVTNSNPPPAAGGGGGYYIQRWRQDQQQQLGVMTSTSSSSTGMLTSCPVTLSGGGTTDPAKAIAAATVAATTMKGGYLQSHQSSSAAFSYGGRTVPVTDQVNKPVEQKQQAGNDNLHGPPVKK